MNTTPRTMPVHKNGGLRLAAVLASCAAVLVTVTAMPPAAEENAAKPGVLPDPVPLQRVFASPNRLAAEFERVRQGLLVQLPRKEFEDRVQRAARAVEFDKQPPRLVEARYRAVLQDTDLVGVASWKILNPDTSKNTRQRPPGDKTALPSKKPNNSDSEPPRILPLEPFNLALRRARWLDNKDAVVGQLDGKDLGLLVEQPGNQTLSLEWSTRGNSIPGEVQFNLEVPACAIATLELELPADRTVAVVGEGLLTGPHAAPTGGWQTWRISFAGRSQLSLEVRRDHGPQRPPPRIFTRLQTTEQTLAPGLLTTQFWFDLEVRNASIRTLVCECDPTLQPEEVRLPNLESWRLLPGPTPAHPSTLLVHARDWFKGGTLQVRCLAPLASQGRWTCPQIRLLHGLESPDPAADPPRQVPVLPRPESIGVRVHPELQLEDWRPGGYRITDGSFDADGWHTVNLAAGLDVGATGQRPSAQVRQHESAYEVRQVAWWQIGPEQSQLTVRMTIEVLRGKMFRLPLLLPSGFEAELVELSPKDLLGNYSVVAEDGRQALKVDLKRAVASGEPVQVTLQLRAGHNVPNSGLTLPLPDVLPVGSSFREGALAISVDRAYEATIAASVPASVPAASAGRPVQGEKGGTGNPWPEFPWGKASPEHFYTYRGQPVAGTLVLRRRPPDFAARCETEVGIARGKVLVETRLHLEAVAGTTTTVDLLLSGLAPAESNWKILRGRNQIKNVERLRVWQIASPLRAVGAPSALESVGLLAAQMWPVSEWRLTFAQPLREPITLETSCELSGRALPTEALCHLTPLAARELLPALALMAAADLSFGAFTRQWDWEVPLAFLQLPHRTTGEVNLRLASPNLVQVRSAGLWEVPPLRRADATAGWRRFRYDRLPVGLTLYGQASAQDRAAEPIVQQAALTTSVERSGRLLHCFWFEVSNWREDYFTIRLPADAAVLSAEVDGRWIENVKQPRVMESSEPQNAQPKMVFGLPVPAGRAVHRFKIVYSRQIPPWAIWAQIPTPLPELPREPEQVFPLRTIVSFRRAWRLPPDIAPLVGGLYHRVQGGSAPGWADLGVERWSEPSSRVAYLIRPLISGDETLRQRQILLDALSKAPQEASPGQPGTVAARLERLALSGRPGEPPLIIDAVAVAEAGIHLSAAVAPATENSTEAGASLPQGVVPILSLPNANLVALPCLHGAIITTPSQIEAWQSAGGQNDYLPEFVEEAAAQAATVGHDSSARFYRLIDWLERSHEPAAERCAGDVLTADWSEWEPIAGAEHDDTLVVIRADVPAAAGLAAACVLALVFLRLAFSGWKGFFPLVVLCLTAGALALIWIPAELRAVAAWPALVAIIAATGYCLGSAAARWGQPSTRMARTSGAGPVVAAILALVGVAALPGRAAAPNPVTVLIVPGPADAPEKQTVLAPPELLERLQALSRPAAAAVLSSAQFEGRVVESTAEFTARFHVYCTTGKPATVTLSLGGVQLLDDALLDGAHVFPSALRAPREGYTLQVQGRGTHTVVLRFAVPLQGSGDDQELRFTIPGLPQSRLKLTKPAGARSFDVVGAVGAQRHSVDVLPLLTGLAASLQSSPVTPLPFFYLPAVHYLEADLGRIKPDPRGSIPLQVRWRQDSGPVRPATVQVQEAYYWDLQVSDSRLLAVLQYSVSQGATRRLAVSLPRELEVRSVDAGPLPDNPPGPRLKDWSLTDTKEDRQLQLEFQAPVMGSVQVTLELAPKRPLGSNAVLPFPKPLGAQPKQEGLLAFRLQGLEATVAEFRSITGINVEEQAFIKTFETGMARPWLRARQEGIDLPTSAFWRTPGGTPFLRLQLREAIGTVRSEQQIVWRVGRRQADFRATARLSCPGPGLALIECNVPADVAVTELIGRDVRYWSRRGSRVQVWLQRALSETELQMTGWLARGTSQGSPAAETFALPELRVLSADASTTYIDVAAGDGLGIIAAGLKNLWPMPDSRPPGQEPSYVTQQPHYQASFRMQPAGPQPNRRQLTTAEVRDGRLLFSANVEVAIPAAGPRTLAVRLRNWGESPIRLGAKQVARLSADAEIQELPQEGFLIRPHHSPAGPAHGERRLTMELEPGVVRSYRFRLFSSIPLGQAVGTVFPDVEVTSSGGAVRPQRWVALLGTDLIAEETARVAPVELAQLRPWWPEEAERLRVGGSIWQVTGEDWRVRLRPRYVSMAAGPIQVFLTEHTVAVADGRGWLHQITYWLVHSAGADLRVNLPPGARPLTAAVDGRMTAVPADSQGLRLPLTGEAGMRTVRVTWTYQPGQEPLDRPRLDQPRIDGESAGPILWTIFAPPGYDLDAAGRQGAKSANAAGQNLRRAAALLRLHEALAPLAHQSAAENADTPLLALREQAARQCKFAEARFALPGEMAPDAGPNGQPLSVWREELARQCEQPTPVVGQRAPEPSTSAPASQPPSEASPLLELPECGRSYNFHGDAGGLVPQVQLRPDALRRKEMTWLLSGVTLVLFVLLVLAAGLVGAKCWPEQLLILGGLGFLGFGPDLGWLFLLFPLVWIGVRIGQAGSRLMVWLQPVEEGSGSGIRQPGPAAGS